MIKLVLAQLKNLLGGGASYLFIGLAIFLMFQNWQVKRLAIDRDEARLERDQAMAQVDEKNSVISSQAVQFRRTVTLESEKENAEYLIGSVPDSHDCRRSEPVGAALEWLRGHEAAAAQNDDD